MCFFFFEYLWIWYTFPQIEITQRLFIWFERLYPRFLKNCLKFLKNLKLKLTNFICLFPEIFFSDQISTTKCCWETNKMKSTNFNLNFFEKYKQNAKKVGYKRLNWIKTLCFLIFFSKKSKIFLKNFDCFVFHLFPQK